MSAEPRLLEALVGLPAMTREVISHLVLDPASGQVSVVPDPDHGESFGGPVSTAVGLAVQVDQVAASGLWGQVRTEQVRQGGHDVWRVQLWAEKAERAAWRRRVALASTSAHAAALLSAAGEFKVAQWRRDQALEALRGGVCAGDGQGISRSDLVRLAQVSRSTVYAALEEQAARTAETGESAPAQMDLDWDAPDQGEDREPVTASDLASSTSSMPVTGGIRRGAPGELVRMPLGRSEPCAVCATPARSWLGGVPVHPGECLSALNEQDDPALPTQAPTRSDANVERTDTTTAPVTASSSASMSTMGAGAGAGAGARQGKGQARFTGLAAAIGQGQVFLPGGQVEPWAGESLADAAMLAVTHRLGHGGGKTLPARGEVWIYSDVLEAMGLPADSGVDSLASDAEEQRREKFGALMDTPAVTALAQTGWEMVGTRIGARTVVNHPEHAPGGVALVMPSWGYVAGVPMLDRGDEHVVDAPELVARLQAFADHAGVPWQVAGGITGMALVDRTHPPRKDASVPMGSPVSVVRNAPGEFPSFLRAEERIAPRVVEANFSWWRAWESLSEEERALPYVHAYDHRSHYLNPWTSTSLGVEGLIHLVGDEAVWDGSEKPGYYLVSTWEWPEWSMPDPGRAGGYRVEDGIWVTSHTLKQLEIISPGFTDTLTFFQAYRWGRTNRYLEAAGEILSAGRNEAPKPVADTIKLLYSMTTAKFASRELRANHHLYRPDWRDHIVAASRSAIVRTLVDVRERSGSVALVVDRDLIVFASAEADPVKAWPGNPAKYASPSGGWTQEASAPLAEWGPTALSSRRRTWQYARHMNAMKALGAQAGLMPASAENDVVGEVSADAQH